MKLKPINSAIAKANPNTKLNGRFTQNLQMFSDQVSFSVGCLQKAKDEKVFPEDLIDTLSSLCQRLHANFPKETKPHLITAFGMPVGISVGDELIEDTVQRNQLSNDVVSLGEETFPYFYKGAKELIDDPKDAMFFTLNFILQFPFSINSIEKLNPDYLKERKKMFDKLILDIELSNYNYEEMLALSLAEAKESLESTAEATELDYPFVFARWRSLYAPELFELANVEQGDIERTWDFLQQYSTTR